MGYWDSETHYCVICGAAFEKFRYEKRLTCTPPVTRANDELGLNGQTPTGEGTCLSKLQQVVKEKGIVVPAKPQLSELAPGENGRILFKNEQWVIQLAPYVMIHFKRVFERVAKGEHGTLILSDTLENCRQLSWFRKRFPMPAPDYLEERAAEHALHEERVKQIVIYEQTDFEHELCREPRPYQLTAAKLVQHTKELLVADELGLGKTFTSILAVHKTLPAIVVTMTHLCKQWEAEIKLALPSATVFRPKDTKATSKPLEEKPDFVVLNYRKYTDWAGTLAKYGKSVIFDECQDLRKSNSGKYTAAKTGSSQMQMRIGLSATPVYNYGGEIFNVYDVLCPGKLGTREEFHREWCRGYIGDKAQIIDPVAFGVFLRTEGLMLRRTRKEVGRELPALSIIPYEIDYDYDTFTHYSKGCSELARMLLDDVQLTPGGHMKAAADLDYKMRQATGLAKAKFVADFVKLILELGEPVILFGWHHAVYAEWRRMFADYSPAFFTGKETGPQKDTSLKRFLSGETKLLILSVRAGSGLDGLQKVCRTVVFGELDWAPGVHDQAIGRVFRDQQTDPVSAYFLTTNAGSDPVIMDVLGIKKAQTLFVDPDRPLTESIDPSHLKKLAARVLGRSAPVDDPLAQFCGKR